ncbi:MAG: hypothetical protein AAF727_11805 [Pseudomonadota bacterium]
MKHSKEILTGVGTLAIAVGIGFIMQSSETAQERYGAQARPVLNQETPVAEETPLAVAGSADILLQVQDIELTSASDVAQIPAREADAIVQPAAAFIEEMPQEPETVPSFPACNISAQAVAVPGAMVSLTLDAPCAANERMTVHHNGMMFTETTDDVGAASLTVPALAKEAVFILAFSNGDGAVAQVTVDDLDQYDRVVLQWRGKTGFELHAREFGADYGEPGHQWAGQDANADGFAAGRSGMMTRLGDEDTAEPLVAEVYSFARGMADQSGLIDMSVEAEVTATNCGREIEAQSLELTGDGALKTRNLTLSVPECDAAGSFLVLNNLVSDLKVAAN